MVVTITDVACVLTTMPRLGYIDPYTRQNKSLHCERDNSNSRFEHMSVCQIDTFHHNNIYFIDRLMDNVYLEL